MKKIITLLLFATSALTAQEIPQMKLTPNGVEPVVVPVEGKTAHELYEKSINWVQNTWKNPESVLKAKIVDEKIRVEGIKGNAWYVKGLMKVWVDVYYTVEVEFKDGRYRFAYTIGKFVGADGTPHNYSYDVFWKKDGTLRGMYSDAPKMLEDEMNGLNKSLYEYITSSGSAKKSEW